MKNDLPNLLTSVLEKETIKELIGDYELMINTRSYNNALYKKKVQKYISQIHLRMIRMKNKKIKDSYDKNEYFVYRLKNKLVNLLSYPDSQEFFIEDSTQGIEEHGKKRRSKV